jgi:GTP-binding protein HflX
LLNALTNAKVASENKLFATLDPITRKIFLPSGKQAVLTDTVGFINNLPHNLIEAFKATFEEINEANLILHVHDASHPLQKEHATTVSNLLKDLHVDSQKVLNVYNKMDIVRSQTNVNRILPFVNVSALTGQGLDELLSVIDEQFKKTLVKTDLYLPLNDTSLLFKLARDAKIISQEQGDHIIHCKVEIAEDALQRWSKYL